MVLEIAFLYVCTSCSYNRTISNWWKKREYWQRHNMHIKTSPLKYPNCVQIKSSFIALRRLYGICIAWFFQGLDLKNKTDVCLLNSNYLFSAIYSRQHCKIYLFEKNIIFYVLQNRKFRWSNDYIKPIDIFSFWVMIPNLFSFIFRNTVHGIPIKFILFF